GVTASAAAVPLVIMTGRGGRARSPPGREPHHHVADRSDTAHGPKGKAANPAPEADYQSTHIHARMRHAHLRSTGRASGVPILAPASAPWPAVAGVNVQCP